MDAVDLTQQCPLDPNKTFQEYGDVDPAQGCIALTVGEPYALLVVSGRRRGQVLFYDSNTYWCEVAEAVCGPLGFLAWYEAWLDATEPAKPSLHSSVSASRRLGEALVGSEEELICALKNSERDSRRCTKAVVGLAIRNRVRPDTLMAIEEASADSSPAVRLEAMKALYHHAAERRVEKVSRFARDESGLVRRGMVQLLRGDEGRQSVDILRFLVEDKERTVSFAALAALLSKAQGDDYSWFLSRRSILEDPDSRELLLHSLGDRRDSRWVPELLSFLTHFDARTRMVAVVNLGKLGDPSVNEAIHRRLAAEPAESVRKAISRLKG